MDIKSVIAEISAQLGPPKPRAAFGTWTPLAWVVRGLVERGHGITEAVNHVLDNAGIVHNERSFGSLRASYYKIRGAEWPAQFAAKDESETFE